MQKTFSLIQSDNWPTLSVFTLQKTTRKKYPVVLHVNPSEEHLFPFRNGELLWFEIWQENCTELDCFVVSELFFDRNGTLYSGYSKEDFRVVPDSEILNISFSKKIF